MTAATGPGDRILTLDIVRGVAVMGILAMNIIAFALPTPAYVNPMSAGIDDDADFASWVLSFVLIDGRMRGLFSFLFGASMLLVIERANIAGASGARVHFSRMAWLLVFGLIHFYLIWYGDILISYALVGMLAFLFTGMDRRRLVQWGIGLLLLQLLITGLSTIGYFAVAAQAAAPNPPAEVLEQLRQMSTNFGVLPGEVERDLAIHRGSYGDLLHHRFTELASWPLFMLTLSGPETLAYFLFGMCGLRSGFLTGAWEDRAYLRVAAICLAISIPAYALLAYVHVEHGFRPEIIHAVNFAATTPFRPLMIIAFAALIISATRGGGALTARIAAAGRAAFTNYLGTSILMTTLFYGYGFGLFGTMGRAELWLVVFAMWGLMLLWSKPWLDRFAYGPFEWLWRSLSRWEWQSMRKRLPA